MTERTELVQEQMAAFNRRDVDAVMEVFAADVEWWPLRSSTEGPYRGHDGIRAWFDDTAQMFDELEAHVDDVVESDAVVVAVGRLSVRGRGSGAALEVPIAWVFRFLDDQIVWGKTFSEREEAYAAAGLKPPS
jgi:ketosteroid isomerase-like protein